MFLLYLLFIYLALPTRAGSPQQHMPITVGPFCLTHPVNFPTGYDKSLIYQAFVRAREYQTSGKAAIIVISPLNSIYIKDQLKDMERPAMFLVRGCLNHYNYYNHYSLYATESLSS